MDKLQYEKRENVLTSGGLVIKVHIERIYIGGDGKCTYQKNDHRNLNTKQQHTN